MKRILLGLVLLLLTVAAAAHIAYWYWPRERPAVPDPATAVYRLLSDQKYGLCVWVPFPHQNLGALAAAVPDWPAMVSAAARLAGAHAAEEVHTFGPFAVPPSRELVACTDRSGGRLRIAARVYPGLALLARLAGRLASNPWLSGGEVGRLRVSWDEGVWSVVGGDEEPASGRSSLPPAAAVPPSLAIVQVGTAFPELPAGTYRLRHRAADFALERDGSAPGVDALLAPPGAAQPVLVAFVDPGRESASTGGRGPSAIALFPHSGNLWSGSLGKRRVSLEIPGVAVLHPAGTTGWGLPGGTVGRLLAGAPQQGLVNGWSVQALDEEALHSAIALVPRLEALRGGGRDFTIAVWADPRAALTVVSRVRQALDGLPFAPRAQVHLWRDWETILGAFGSCQQASLVSRQGEVPVFHLLIAGCGSAVP